MLNIALPKGRLGDQVYELLASVGYDCKSTVSYTHLTLPTIA